MSAALQLYAQLTEASDESSIFPLIRLRLDAERPQWFDQLLGALVELEKGLETLPVRLQPQSPAQRKRCGSGFIREAPRSESAVGAASSAKRSESAIGQTLP